MFAGLFASKVFGPLALIGIAAATTTIGVQQYRVVSLKNEISDMVVAQQEAIIEAQRLAREDQEERDELSKVAAVNAALAQKQIEYVTNTIIREIPNEITPEINSAFIVPYGLVRSHDAAASRNSFYALPNPTGRDNDSPAESIATMSRIAAVQADNYGVCHSVAQRLIAAQKWIRDQENIVLSAGNN